MRSNRGVAAPGTAILALVCLAIAAVVLLPVVYLVLRASELGFDEVRALLVRARTVELLGNTAGLAVMVTLLATALGFGLAMLAARCGRSRWLLLTLLATPLAIPSYVAGFVWTRLIIGFEGFWAAVLVLVLASYPLVMLPVAAALVSAGRAREDAARTLGLSPAAVVVRVTLRRVWPAGVGGALLVALYAVSDFGGPAMVRFEPFTVGIYNAYNGAFDRSTPAVYGCVLVVVAVILVLAERLVRRPTESTAAVDRAPKPGGVAQAWVVGGLVLIVAVVVPIVGLVRDITQSRRLGFGSVGDAVAWAWPDLQATASLSVTAAAVITVVALPVGLYTARPAGPASGIIESATHMGYALPGITVALAMVFVGIRLLPDWYGSTTMLVACYAILFLPVCVGPMRQAFDAIPSGIPDAARSLGASPAGVLARVQLPLALPGIAAGAALAALSVAKELPATLMLAPIGTSTLASHMWSLNNDLAYGRAAILGLILIVVSSLPTVLLSALLTRRIR